MISLWDGKFMFFQRNISSFILKKTLTWGEIKSRKTFPSLILSSNFWCQNNWQYCLAQAIASLFGIAVFFGFSNLYATVVCVACSQCEKLRAALLNIRQTLVIIEREPGDESCQQDSERQTHTIEQGFQHMQKQLNECIRHHQDIKRYEHKSSTFNLYFFHCSARKNIVLQYNLVFFRYVSMLEDTMNLPMCGLFLLILSAMCLDALSVVTVNISA